METASITKEQLLSIAKQYYPKSYLREDGRIRLTKGSGYHLERTIINQIIQRKIDLKLAEYINNGATDIVSSRSTKSVYFTYESVPHRISDHEKFFDGAQIIIRLEIKPL